MSVSICSDFGSIFSTDKSVGMTMCVSLTW
jgi:hypothetical protein